MFVMLIWFSRDTCEQQNIVEAMHTACDGVDKCARCSASFSNLHGATSLLVVTTRDALVLL